jgi:spermidine/putrescine transport system substrate-binding protein
VDTDSYKGDINTTDILFNTPDELKGKVNILDSQGEVMAMAAMHLGIPQCSTDRDQLKALNDMLQNAKADWASFNSDTAKEVLVAGDVTVGMIWDGFSAKARAEKPSITYAFPTQGYVVWMDNVVLLKDAPNRENAIKFMDFLLMPENIAQVSNFARYGLGVKDAGAFLDPELANAPEANPHEGAGPGAFVQACDQETQAVYDQIWTNVKK